MKETTFLDEAGLVITSTYIATPSHRFTFRGIKNIRLVEPSPLNPLRLIEKQPYRLFVNDFKTEVVAFETFDAALIERLKVALTASKNCHVPNRGIVRKA